MTFSLDSFGISKIILIKSSEITLIRLSNRLEIRKGDSKEAGESWFLFILATIETRMISFEITLSLRKKSEIRNLKSEINLLSLRSLKFKVKECLQFNS